MERNNSQQVEPTQEQKAQSFSPFNARNRFSFFGNEGEDE